MGFVIDGLGALFGDRGLGIFFPFLIHYFIVYNGCIHDFFFNENDRLLAVFGKF